MEPKQVLRRSKRITRNSSKKTYHEPPETIDLNQEKNIERKIATTLPYSQSPAKKTCEIDPAQQQSYDYLDALEKKVQQKVNNLLEFEFYEYCLHDDAPIFNPEP